MPIINAHDHRPKSIFSKVKDGILGIINMFHVKQEITVVPADDPGNLRLGWVIYEEIGMAVINDYATSKIVISDDA